uniref:Uncharacterized protein n=1 Tax=Plectus sambesii TaxID=2011161 RepID=A0A914VT91_9BILA
MKLTLSRGYPPLAVLPPVGKDIKPIKKQSSFMEQFQRQKKTAAISVEEMEKNDMAAFKRAGQKPPPRFTARYLIKCLRVTKRHMANVAFWREVALLHDSILIFTDSLCLPASRWRTL